MLQPKYQVAIRVLRHLDETLLKCSFSRPLENQVFIGLKSELDAYNFKTEYDYNPVSDHTDIRVVNVKFDHNLYGVEDVLNYLVDFLKSEGFESFLFIMGNVGAEKKSTDLNDII